MSGYRLILYADGKALPIVVHLRTDRPDPGMYLREALRYDLVLTRAEVWSGSKKIRTFTTDDFAQIVRDRDADVANNPVLN